MKENIIEKATDMFLTHGFKTVTMDYLASEMGISKKTIYAHFSNKNDLIVGVTDQLFKDISQGINHICTLDKNPIEEIYEIKRFAVLHLKDEKSSPQYQLLKYYPKIFKGLQKKQFSLMQDCFLRNIQKGMAQGIYRENLDPDFIVRIYFSGVNAIKNVDLFPSAMYGIGETMNKYLEYHLRGIVSAQGLTVLKQTLKGD